MTTIIGWAEFHVYLTGFLGDRSNGHFTRKLSIKHKSEGKAIGMPCMSERHVEPVGTAVSLQSFVVCLLEAPVRNSMI